MDAIQLSVITVRKEPGYTNFGKQLLLSWPKKSKSLSCNIALKKYLSWDPFSQHRQWKLLVGPSCPPRVGPTTTWFWVSARTLLHQSVIETPVLGMCLSFLLCGGSAVCLTFRWFGSGSSSDGGNSAWLGAFCSCLAPGRQDGHRCSCQGRGGVGGVGLLVAAHCWVVAELVGCGEADTWIETSHLFPWRLLKSPASARCPALFLTWLGRRLLGARGRGIN